MCHHEDYKVNWPEKAETMTYRGDQAYVGANRTFQMCIGVQEALYRDRVERVAKAIWEAQHAKVQGAVSKKRKWGDNSVPAIFWDGYRNDAMAALRALGLVPDAIITPTIQGQK